MPAPSTDPRPDAVSRPASEGRVGTLLAPPRLADLVPSRGPISTSTVPLLDAGRFGACRRPAVDARPVSGGPFDR